MAQVVTGKVRFSYLNAFEPRSNNGGEPKVFCNFTHPQNRCSHKASNRQRD